MNQNHINPPRTLVDALLTEKVAMWLAWRLPRRLAYWATVRVVAYDYDGNPAERSVVEALTGWPK